LKEEKNQLQKALGTQKALPDKIARERESMETILAARIAYRQAVNLSKQKTDSAIAAKLKDVFRHIENIAQIRLCHEELLEAELRLVEAVSDANVLAERNQDIVRQVEEERQLAQEAERGAAEATEQARAARDICAEIAAEVEAAGGDVTYFHDMPADKTVEALKIERDAEAAKLEFIHDSDPNAIATYERREAEIARLTSKINDTQERLRALGDNIHETRAKWEPELDKLIAEISDAFSHNFEQIGCAGEVSVHKDEDFDLWSIEIKVKFRENETLQILDAHRQSGGERSVSTIFYLMSLQSLARAPFRVVDEINQGMDPRNERMVHERMVEIACKEHTSQYFLITPKLLTGLRYDRRMRVLCIASGEHMPDNHTQLDVMKIIENRRLVKAGL